MSIHPATAMPWRRNRLGDDTHPLLMIHHEAYDNSGQQCSDRMRVPTHELGTDSNSETKPSSCRLEAVWIAREVDGGFETSWRDMPAEEHGTC